MTQDSPQGLTCRQADVFDVIEGYFTVMQEPVPVRTLARRFHIHHKSAQRLISVLHRKGWLRTSGQAIPVRRTPHSRQFGG